MRIKQIVLLLLPALLILYYYKNLFVNIGTHLTGWYDSPFVIWVFQNNIKHFASLDFAHIFDTNAMYPFRNTLSFTEHMFFPSIIAFVISLFNKNPLLQFNLITILNHLAVYFSFYLLSSRFTKNNEIRVIASFLASFSPYLLGQMGHLQMVMVWPFYISLYSFLDPKRNLKHLILCGLFLGIQFHCAVYLGLMGLFVLFAYWVVQTVIYKRYVIAVRNLAVILAVFLVVILPSLYGYLKMQALYRPYRGQEEFVNYSAHISDYFLVAPNNSLFDKSIFNRTAGSLNKHVRGEMAAFVGLIPLSLITYWLFKTKLHAKSGNDLDRKAIIIWLILLIAVGVVFSVGPRANFNGRYLVFPLPYYFILKLFPPIGIMRAVARWYFVVMLAVNILFIYAADFMSSSFKNNVYKKLLLPALFILLILEFYSPPVQVTARDWASPSYLYLQKVCKSNPGAVLIYPFEYRYKSDDIGKYLSIKTNQLMSSTLYDCSTLSGFSSFEPPLYKEWQKDFDSNGVTDKNLQILKENKFAYVMINLEAISKEEKENPQSVIHTKALKEVFKDNYSIVYRIIK